MASPYPWKALSKLLTENVFRRQHCRRWRGAPMCAEPQSWCSSTHVGSSALLPSPSCDLVVPWEVQNGGGGHLSVPSQESSFCHPHTSGSGAPMEAHFAFLMRCPEGSPVQTLARRREPVCGGDFPSQSLWCLLSMPKPVSPLLSVPPIPVSERFPSGQCGCVYLVVFLEGQGPGTQTLVSSHLLVSTLGYVKLEENSASLKLEETLASWKRLEQAWLGDLPPCANSSLRADRLPSSSSHLSLK